MEKREREKIIGRGRQGSVVDGVGVRVRVRVGVGVGSGAGELLICGFLDRFTLDGSYVDKRHILIFRGGNNNLSVVSACDSGWIPWWASRGEHHDFKFVFAGKTSST